MTNEQSPKPVRARRLGRIPKMPVNGGKIQELRIEKEWSQEELAAATGYSKGYVSQAERDLVNMSPEAQRIFAQVLDTTVEGLQGRKVTIPQEVKIPREVLLQILKYVEGFDQSLERIQRRSLVTFEEYEQHMDECHSDQSKISPLGG